MGDEGFIWFVVSDFGYNGLQVDDYEFKSDAEDAVNRLKKTPEVESLYVIYGKRVPIVESQWRIASEETASSQTKGEPVRQALWDLLCSMVDDPDDDEEVSLALSRLRSAA